MDSSWGAQCWGSIEHEDGGGHRGHEGQTGGVPDGDQVDTDKLTTDDERQDAQVHGQVCCFARCQAEHTGPQTSTIHVQTTITTLAHTVCML